MCTQPFLHRHVATTTSRNKQWNNFLCRPKITYQPVERRHLGEASDHAIGRALQTCRDTQIFALLISDFDFLGIVKQAATNNKEVLVFIPSQKGSLIQRYHSVGVPVCELKSRIPRFPTVRAILQQDGDGSSQLGSPYQHISAI